MQRSPELMKLILLYVKSSPQALSLADIQIPGYSSEEIADHVYVLLITEHMHGEVKESSDGSLDFGKVNGITERGQEYLIIADQITDEQMLVQYLNRRPQRELPQLHSGILVTDDPGYDYPLQFFNLFVIVEPDEEEWEPHPDSDEENLEVQQPWDIHCEMLENELDPDSDIEAANPVISMQRENQILWLCNSIFNYYADFTFPNASVIFRRDYKDFGPPESMVWYLQSVQKYHPEWKVAVVGGTFEDEVTITANLLHEMGFNTTILTRYCLSANGFKQVQGSPFMRLLPPDLFDVD